MSGYATPEKIVVNAEGVELFADQTAGAVTWINFSYQGANALTALMFVILFLFFFKIDREMPVVTKTLTERRKAECEALGIPYVSPQEQQRAEIMEQQKEAEANRVKELREKCEKKGRDFEEEYRKYLEKQAKKKARKAKQKEKNS